MQFKAREIVYRAWDVEEKTMHYYCPLSSFHGVDSTNGKRNRHDKRAWMTWIGNTYNNGTLQNFIYLQGVIKTDERTLTVFGEGWIFEGDIVQFTDCDGEEIKGFIVWNEETNRYMVCDSNGLFCPLDSRVKYTVLGNVFENSELL